MIAQASFFFDRRSSPADATPKAASAYCAF
jgi:hypothetical protein